MNGVKFEEDLQGTASMFPSLAQISLSSKELYIYIFLCSKSVVKKINFFYFKLIFF
jgi:hypothetical protein